MTSTIVRPCDVPLTAHNLRTAAADLHNAARIVDHLGHDRGQMVDTTSAAVCAVGAVNLATSHQLVAIEYVAPYQFGGAADTVNHFYDQRIRERHDFSRPTNLFHREQVASWCLATFLPQGMCDECNIDGQGWKPRAATDIVIHYNDNHCVGGHVLINMMNLAADMALVKAEGLELAERLGMALTNA
jgi:hypothetical protein